MIHLSTLLQYYKRPEVQEAIVREAKDKEIAVSFGGAGYGKRPDTLQFPNDILEFAKKGVTSFHCSEELWSNPLQITTGMKRQELDDIRTGWDLVLDIDCPELNYSKIAGDLLVNAMGYHGVKNIAVKFSGNHGFHLAVPFESFPEYVNGKLTKDLFPDGPRKIAAYLANMIRPELAKRLLAFHDIGQIIKRTGFPREKIIKDGVFDPFNVLAIDTVLIAPRHLYRMAYSFNEKSGLVSVPVSPDKILAFDKDNAKAENVITDQVFMDRTKSVPGEARKLLMNSFDFVEMGTARKEENESIKPKRDFGIPTQALSENLFPPCMKLAAKGMKDGKKRALFAIVNFLQSVGWEHDKILEWVKEWNAKNAEPLRDTIIEGHVRYHKQSKKKILPPNCKQYWEDLGLCKPDGLCARIKNPVSYATRRAWMLNRVKEEEKEKKGTSKDK